MFSGMVQKECECLLSPPPCKYAEIALRFLWVQFQLEELCRMETDATIVKALQNLPRNLEETYDRLLGRIIGIERREFVRRMFDWIICSCRPLHMDELREAIAFTIGDRSWDATKIPNDLRRLIRACGNLIMIDEETLEVHLAHYTGKIIYTTNHARKLGGGSLSRHFFHQQPTQGMNGD